MPKGTALWLIENTSLTFEQIADFCGIHILEVQTIADGDAAVSTFGFDPVAHSQVTMEDLERCAQDPKARLILVPHENLNTKRKGARYTPMALRQDKPDVIAWLLRNCPDLSFAQIALLVGSTKNTIQSIHDRTHWNSMNIKPRNPVVLGICTQMDLDEAMEKSRKTVSSSASSEEVEP